MSNLGVRGHVTIGQLRDIVAAVGDSPTAVDSEVRTIYEWHHARGVMGIQLAMTSAVVAAVATFAGDRSQYAVPAGIALAVAFLSFAGWLLVRLNRLPGEYALALRVARQLQAHRSDLSLSNDVLLFAHGPSDAITMTRFLRDPDAASVEAGVPHDSGYQPPPRGGKTPP